MVVDHLGNTYKNFQYMCEAYYKGIRVVRERLNRGVPLGRALTTPVYIGGPLFYEGIYFNSLEEVSENYRVGYGLVMSRLDLGWSLKDSLMGRPNSIVYGGREYPSFASLGRDYGIPGSLISSKLKSGYSLGSILQES